MINLCECKPGDFLISKSGRFHVYSHYRGEFSGMYPHIAVSNTRKFTFSFTDDGRYHIPIGPTDNDIVKIIPQETPNIYFTLYEHKKRSTLL